MKYNPEELIVFALYRETDQSGVSGEGTVAYGIRFPDPNGRVVLGWVADKHDYTSAAVYDSIEAIENIHGHGGKTKLIPHFRFDTGSP